MAEIFRITLVQASLEWENIDANLKLFSEKLEHISKTDLIVLPEMFSTGFSMNASALAEQSEGRTFQWMLQQAKDHDTAVTGSFIVKEKDNFFNRLFFIFPNGEFKKYDKKHTFTLAGEHKVYSKGETRLVVNYKGWKICPLVCYDLRFPVWARNTEDFDVLIYVANWPEKRISAWDALLKARAIENMCYCVGVNRIGIDGNNYAYPGHSAIYNVLGDQISTTNFEKEFNETVFLEKTHIQESREQLMFLEDRDDFTLK